MENTTDIPQIVSDRVDENPDNRPNDDLAGKVSNGEISPEVEEEEWMDILGSGQLKKKVVKRADDTYRPERSHVCLVNIEGSLVDGTIVEKMDSFHFQIGDGEVIQGLDLALPLMYVGEEALLEVDARFAYGALGNKPDIGPNQKLFYKVQLLSAEPEREIESYSTAERKAIGNCKRERGNWWYFRSEPILAIQCYRRALDYLDEVEGGIILQPEEKPVDEDLIALFEDRLKVYNNLAAAQMKINALDSALQSVQNVLSCQPNNVKALFRKGKILSAKGDFKSSGTVLRKASILEPDNKLIRQELNKVLNLDKEGTKQETNLYKKMLGQNKETRNATCESPQQSRLYPWVLMITSTAIVVAGMVAYRYKYL